jgi:putative colanic acid biosynthesis glycosyltransferase
MKVLQINSVCGIRSTGRICTDIADVLTKNGHECKIAYGRETVPERYQKYAVRIGSDFDVNMHAFKTRLFDDSGFGSKQATERLIKRVKAYDPDLIHLHNIHGYYINIEVLFNYLKTCGKKIIWTLHDCWEFTGHCSYFTAIKCAKWKTGCFNCPQKTRYPASYLCDHSKQNWNQKKNLFTSVNNMTIVTPSNWLARLVKESFLNKYPVKVIYNGIDTDIFKPISSDFRAKYNLKNKKIILGVASVWDKRKGINDFIKLSGMLDDSYILVLVGLHKKQLKSLPRNIVGITRTNNTNELAAIYNAADVFVNPTYEDNFPTTNLEAIACETPVITYNTGGSPEALVFPELGQVMEQGNIEALANAICRFPADLSSQVFSKAAEKFDKKARYQEYLELYR